MDGMDGHGWVWVARVGMVKMEDEQQHLHRGIREVCAYMT